MTAMRGLTVFIADIRNCRVRELEEKRIYKEMANIRSKFKDAHLSGYQKKKYVCKLLYMYMLGWEIDFGHPEALSLIASTNYSEKQIGYLAVTLLLHENHDLIRLVVNSAKKDLEDLNEINNCLALHAIANIAGREMAESLALDVHRLLISPTSKSFVKKKAALTLLRLYRKYPDVMPVSDWAERIVDLLDEYDLGVTLSATSLVLELAQNHPTEYRGCYPKAVNRLRRILVDRDYSLDYVYYKVPIPWLQVKLLRLLQYYPPPDDPQLRLAVSELMAIIMSRAREQPPSIQHSNAQKAVLFEAIHLAIHLDSNSTVCQHAAELLAQFISSRETNVRYLGLETLAHLAASADSLGPIKEHLKTILLLLRDRDISVRRRALDLMYSMCDTDNCKVIVAELLRYLPGADYAMREEMVLKVAILTEKFATHLEWYVDTILRLIAMAGDQVGPQVWHRVIQIVTNHEPLQAYAARMALYHVRAPDYNETMLNVAGYILGEFGHLIANEPDARPIDQFAAIHRKFVVASFGTRALLLTTYIKFVNLFPEIKGHVLGVLDKYRHVLDPELQQRACEYMAIATMATDTMLQTVCEEMPPFPRDRVAGGMLVKLTEKPMEDKSVWPAAATTTNQETLDAIPLAPDYALGLYPLAYLSQAVLYQNASVQITATTMFGDAGGHGRVGLLLRNLRPQAIRRLRIHVQSPSPGLLVRVSSTDEDTMVPPEAETTYTIQAEIVDVFDDLASVWVLGEFQDGPGSSLELHLKLPIFLSKFQGPISSMDGPSFFRRWNQLGSGPPHEAQAVFTHHPRGSSSSSGIDLGQVARVLRGFGLGLLENVDPNPNNFVGAGVIDMGKQGGKVGVLVRLEPSMEHNMFRLTVRTPSERVSRNLQTWMERLL